MKQVKASMAGTVIHILVTEGDYVQVGQDVVLIESMKMEIPQVAEIEGKVTKVHCSIGDFVNEGEALITLDS